MPKFMNMESTLRGICQRWMCGADFSLPNLLVPFFFTNKTRQLVDLLIQFDLVQVRDRQLQVIFPTGRHTITSGTLGIMPLHWYAFALKLIFWIFSSFFGNGIPITLLSHRHQLPDFYVFGINKNQTCVAWFHKIQNWFTFNCLSVVQL